MAEARWPRLANPKRGRKLAEGKQANVKAAAAQRVNAVSLRKLARAHTETALQVLADVATTGSSEASRISAAMALLDRGYGKSGTGQSSDGEAPVPVLYQRIILVDGTPEKSDRDRAAADDPDRAAAAAAGGV